MGRRTVHAVAALLLGAVFAAPTGIGAQERPGWIGVSIDILATSDGVEAPRTLVRIADVQQGSPAALAGLRRGDVLLEVNELVGANELARLGEVLRLQVGDPVRVVVRRDGAEREVRLKAVERPAVVMPPMPPAAFGPDADSMVESLVRAMDSLRVRIERDEPARIFIRETTPGTPRPAVAPSAAPRPGGPEVWVDVSGAFSPLTPYVLGRNRVAGAEVIDVQPDLARYFGVEAGVLVVDVPAGTPAAAASLRAGDIIVQLGDTPIRSVTDLRSAVARAGNGIPVELVRHGTRLRVLLPR